MLKSANLLHKWGLGDSDMNRTVIYPEIMHVQMLLIVFQYGPSLSRDLT